MGHVRHGLGIDRLVWGDSRRFDRFSSVSTMVEENA
jgi:hypothetical protein